MSIGADETPSFAPNELHARLMANAPRRLGFRGQADAAWSDALRRKLVEILRLPPAISTPPKLHWRGKTVDCGDHSRRELLVEAEPGADIPISLLLPKAPGPHPVMLCLQGHTTGRHISLGETRYDGDEAFLSGGDRDFARQAVARGYAALAIEQRSFGERSDDRPETARNTAGLRRHDDNRSCKHAAMTALLLGRTLLGERVFDVSRVCDAVEQIPELDASAIHLIGQSGGGTVG